MAASLQLREYSVKQFKLSTGPEDVWTMDNVESTKMPGVTLLHMLEHEGVVAELSELHDGVHQCLRPALCQEAGTPRPS